MNKCGLCGATMVRQRIPTLRANIDMLGCRNRNCDQYIEELIETWMFDAQLEVEEQFRAE